MEEIDFFFFHSWFYFLDFINDLALVGVTLHRVLNIDANVSNETHMIYDNLLMLMLK